MSQGRKSRAQEIVTELQKSTTHEARTMKELVNLLFEDAKHNLVTAQGDDILRLQGGAQALRRLFRDLSEPSPVTKEQQRVD